MLLASTPKKPVLDQSGRWLSAPIGHSRLRQTFSKAPPMFIQGVRAKFSEPRKRPLCVGRRWESLHRLYQWVRSRNSRPRLRPRERCGVRTDAARRQFQSASPDRSGSCGIVVRAHPVREMVRFGKNGSDATAGAVRLARTFTGAISCSAAGITDGRIGILAPRRGIWVCLRQFGS